MAQQSRISKSEETGICIDWGQTLSVPVKLCCMLEARIDSTPPQVHGDLSVEYERDAPSGTVRFALHSRAPGYASIGFTGRRGMMDPALGVIAYMSGGLPRVQVYHMKSEVVMPKDLTAELPVRGAQGSVPIRIHCMALAQARG